MALSLVVVAGATETGNESVYLKTQKTVNGNEVTYTFTLDTGKSDGVGALQFDVKPADGLKFKSKTYPEGKKLQDVFEVVDFDGMKGSAGFHEGENRFIAYGSNAKVNPPRVLKGTVVLVSVTYTITDSSNCDLTVEGFKACFSGEKAALADGTGKYDCVAEPIDGGKGVTVTPQCDALKDAYTANGQTVTVTYNIPCRVGYLSGDKYVAVTPTKNGDSYDFAVPAGVTEVILVVKGDVNNDGVVDSKDKVFLSRSLLMPSHAAHYSMSAIASFAVDLDNNNTITSIDKVLLSRSLLMSSHAAHQALTW